MSNIFPSLNLFPDDADEFFSYLVKRKYPFEVEFQIYKSIELELYRVDCMSCKELGLGWGTTVTTALITQVRYLPDLLRGLREKLENHAQEHGSPIVRGLIRKYDPELLKEIDYEFNERQKDTTNWVKCDPVFIGRNIEVEG